MSKDTLIVKVSRDGTIPIAIFKLFLDVNKSVYYRLWLLKNDCIKIRFYDKKGKWIKNNNA